MTPDLSESKHQMCRCSSDKSKRDGATRSWTSAATGRHARRGQPPRFIGRSAELETFEALLARPDHVSVLWLSGLGGVGKTALMQVCAGQARQAGWLTARVDGRTVAHSPRAFAGAVESAVTTDRSLPEVDGADATGLAIFIDTYERLESLDGWLREQYLPSLPAQTLIMIASRQLPSIEWRTDRWAAVLQVLPLRNFRPEESHAYLTSRGVPGRCRPRPSASRTATPSRCHCSPTCTGCSPNALPFAILTLPKRSYAGCSTMSRHRCIGGHLKYARICASLLRTGLPRRS